MPSTGGHNTQLSPDAAHTAIDAVMFEEYTREQQPAYVRATDDFWFKQGRTVGDSFIWDEDSNVGSFQATGEQEDLLDTDTFIGNQTSKRSQKWIKQIPISHEIFLADQVGKRARLGTQVGDRARLTQDMQAMLRTYGDAFAEAYHSTPDNEPLASNSHLTLKGATVDNLETGSLTPDNLWTSTVSLANQKAQDGDAGSHVLEGVMVPFTLYKSLKEITNSTLVSSSAENAINIFDTDYGTMRLGASIFLGSAFNSASNANTSYHLVSRNHMIQRKVFFDLETTLIPKEYSSNDTALLRAMFHETTFPGSYTGEVSSNGTT